MAELVAAVACGIRLHSGQDAIPRKNVGRLRTRYTQVSAEVIRPREQAWRRDGRRHHACVRSVAHRTRNVVGYGIGRQLADESVFERYVLESNRSSIDLGSRGHQSENAKSIPALWQYAAMHRVVIRQEIIDRVMARRGRLRWFDRLEAAKTALVTVDMQSTFCAPGGPAEVPSARGIVPNINRLSAAVRRLGCPVLWLLHANSRLGGRVGWRLSFDHVVAADVRARTPESLEPGRQQVWQELETAAEDIVVVKNRYSALVPGSSTLERVLRALGVDTLLIAGTKTNVCCESTARDAMMLDFKVVLLSDCCAALSDDEHRATLETHIQQFGDVATADEALRLLS